MADPQKPSDGAAGSASAPILYKDPRPLDAATLGKWGLKANNTYAFAAKVNAVPIVLSEFQHVQKFYPIVFLGERPTPFCVLGFDQTENLFVNPSGVWYADYYVPAYIRRYPFIFAEVPKDERKFLFVDVESPVVTDKDPVLPFFVDGKPTEIVNQALEFCRMFQQDVAVTQAFCEELHAKKLLKSTELRFTLPNGTQQIAGSFTSIDQPAFEALSESDFANFRKRGFLPCIYFQVTSLTNWPRLHGRKQESAAANNP
jgi:SapC